MTPQPAPAPPLVAAACHWPFGRRRRALASGRCRSRRRDRVTWARRLPEVGVGGHAQDGKTEEESFWSAGEEEEKAEGGGGGRGTGGTRRRRPGLRAGPQGRSCVLRPRADPGAHPGAHPGADPGGEEGPGEEAEEGAEEGGAEAASGGGRSPGPAPEGPVLRCPAGPGLPPRLGPKAGGLEVSEDAADLAAAAHVRRRPGPGGTLPRPAGLPGGAEGPGPRADPAEGRSPDAGAGPGGRRPPGPAPAGEDAARPAGGKRASQGGRVPATRPPIAVASPGCSTKLPVDPSSAGDRSQVAAGTQPGHSSWRHACRRLCEDGTCSLSPRCAHIESPGVPALSAGGCVQGEWGRLWVAGHVHAAAHRDPGGAGWWGRGPLHTCRQALDAPKRGPGGVGEEAEATAATWEPGRVPLGRGPVGWSRVEVSGRSGASRGAEVSLLPAASWGRGGRRAGNRVVPAGGAVKGGAALAGGSAGLSVVPTRRGCGFDPSQGTEENQPLNE